jgi:uncharacterized membrane protein
LAVLIWLAFGVIALFIGVLGSRHGLPFGEYRLFFEFYM